jgi:peptide-methionine (S)-S-oxide reductase
MKFPIIIQTFACLLGCSGFSKAQIHNEISMDTLSEKIKEVFPSENNQKGTFPAGTRKTATFGAGCFWCVEAVFQQLEGVDTVVSGYTGGSVKNPSYKEICGGYTGHAEVAQIVYDPNVISFDELLKAFWLTHDPTTLNYQGNDHGTQYRSAIFYHDETQRMLAMNYKDALNQSGAWPKPIVTTLEPMTVFYPAEEYHQNYFNNNPGQGYCQVIIHPKVEKFKKVFADRLKK